MGTANSKAERARKGPDAVKRPSSQPSQAPRARAERRAPDFPLGVRLSWLVLQFHATLNVDDEATVAKVVEDCVTPLASNGPALNLLASEAYGPATHVVLVHPSTPWSVFIKAVLNHVHVDLKRALLCGEAPLSPRSPLVPFNSSCLRPQSIPTLTTARTTGKPGDPDGPDSPFHQTFLYLDFFATDLGATGGTWGGVGLSAERPLAHMSQPAALLVLDPAGAIFTDPHAVRAIAAAIAILKHPQTQPQSLPRNQPQAQAQSSPSQPQPRPRLPDGHTQQRHQQQRAVQLQPQQLYAEQPSQQLEASTAATLRSPAPAAPPTPSPGPCSDNGGDGDDGDDGNGGLPSAADRPPRLQLASGLAGGDWAPLSAAFGRLAAVLPHDTDATRAVAAEVLAAARAQYLLYCPLFSLYHSHASLGLELECGGLTLAEAKLLPGQIEDGVWGGTAGLGAAAGSVGGVAGSSGAAAATKDSAPASPPALPPVQRSNGPGSQSGIAKISRSHSCLSARAPAPAVPPTDPETLSLARRSGSVTAATAAAAGAGDGARPSSASARQVMLAGASCPTPGSAGASASRGPRAGSPPAGPTKNQPPPGLLSSPPWAHGGVNAGVMSFLRAAQASVTSPPSGSGFGAASPPGGVAVVVGGSGGVRASTASAPVVACRSGSRDPGYSLAPMSADFVAAGLTSVGSVSCQDSIVSYAVEAARRCAALLEAAGLWAEAQGVLESCANAAGERWGHRSAHMAALLSQLGRLQQLQGLHKAAEVTWRQALEALECSHGPESVTSLLGQVALARVLACLRGPEAETMLRSALTSLDTLLGPAAAETLAARTALGEFLLQSGRWAEAEVVYQALLEALEEGGAEEAAADGKRGQGGRPGAGMGAGGVMQAQVQVVPSPRSTTVSSPHRQGVSRAPSRQHLLQGAAVTPTNGGDLPAAAAAAGGGSTVSSTASARGPPWRSESRSRMAWASGSMEGGMGGGGGAGPEAASPVASQAMSWPALRSSLSPLPPIGSASSAVISQVPLSSAALLLPPLLPPMRLGGGGVGLGDAAATAASAPPQRPGTPAGKPQACSGGARAAVGPGAGEPFAWSGAAAALADVVSIVQREYGGLNELYEGMHLAGPEGSTAADIAAAAAVCPRSGACIAAVVNVRRLTDPSTLYDTALTVRRGVVGPAHTSTIDLQLQYARHLSAVGEHARAESVCRTSLELLAAPGGAGATAAGCHPAEVGVRHTLGAVLLAAGSLPAATAALTAAVTVADRLVVSGDLAAADARRLEALDCLADVLWRRATPPAPPPPPPAGPANSPPVTQSAADAAAAPAPAHPGGAVSPASCRAFIERAVEYKRQVIELLVTVYGEHHDRILRGWVALGQMMEAAGDLVGAERAFEAAAEAALYRHSRLSAATKAIFRQLQRVYQAQGRDTDAQLLGHMYRLKGGLLSKTAA